MLDTLRRVTRRLLPLGCLAFPTVALAQGIVPSNPPSATAAPTPSASVSGGPPTPAQALEGKRHFDTGLKLFKEGVFEAALLEFDQAYALGRRPTALRNVAQCHRELKHFALAYETFDTLLATHASELKEPEKKDIRRAMGDLVLVTALLDVRTEPTEVDVAVDGRPVGRGPLPKKVRVDTGTHRVRITKEGFEPVEKEISLFGQQEAKVEATLVPEVNTGHLVVRERSGAEVHVFIDEKDMGPAPWEGDLAPGHHTLSLAGVKHRAPLRPVEVTKKGRAELVIDAPSTAAHLRVVATPSSASIALEGNVVGRGTWDSDVPEGDHRLLVSAEHYTSVERTVRAIAGQTQVENFSLAQEEPKALGGGPPVERDPTPEDYKGIYGAVDLTSLFTLSGNAKVYGPCASEDPDASCSRSQVGALGAMGHFGYAFGWFGVEAVGGFFYEPRSETMGLKGALPAGTTLLTPATRMERTDSVETTGLHGFFGAGPRVSSKDGSARFTLGTALGGLVRTYNVNRALAGDIVASYDESASKTSLAWSADGGVLLGPTPGTKFYLGAIMLWSFGDAIMTPGGAPTPGNLAAGGTLPVERPPFRIAPSGTFYLGPTIGFHFGH